MAERLLQGPRMDRPEHVRAVTVLSEIVDRVHVQETAGERLRVRALLEDFCQCEEPSFVCHSPSNGEGWTRHTRERALGPL